MIPNHIDQLGLRNAKFTHSEFIVSLDEAESFENLSQAVALHTLYLPQSEAMHLEFYTSKQKH